MARRRVLPGRAGSSTASWRSSRNAVSWLVDDEPAPLTSIIIEPAKVLFLNNAINHGVLTPLGIAAGRRRRAHRSCSSLEANPGPGVGLLLALHVLRHRRGAGLRSRRRRDPVLRRHPRGVLPVRAHEADADPGAHRGRRDGCHHQHAPRRRAARTRRPRQHHRGARSDGARQLPRRDPLRGARRGGDLPHRGRHPAGVAQARPRGDGRHG